MKKYTLEKIQMQPQMREEWLDVAKAVAIMAIVFSHAGVDVSPFSYFYVPLFFFASGYVFKDKGIIALVNRLFKRLYLPFVCANIVVLLAHNILYMFHVWNYKVDGTFLWNGILGILRFNIVENIMAQCWFLVALFAVNTGFYLIYRTLGKFQYYKELICGAAVLLGVVAIVWNEQIPQVTWGNCTIIEVTFVGIMFFCAGWITKECGLIDIIKKNMQVALALILSISILILLKYEFSGNTFDYRPMNFSNWSTIIPVAFIGIIWTIILILCLLEISFSKKIMGMLAYIGKHTMPVLLFHTMAFQVVSIFQIYVLSTPPPQT